MGRRKQGRDIPAHAVSPIYLVMNHEVLDSGSDRMPLCPHANLDTDVVFVTHLLRYSATFTFLLRITSTNASLVGRPFLKRDQCVMKYDYPNPFIQGFHQIGFPPLADAFRHVIEHK